MKILKRILLILVVVVLLLVGVSFALPSQHHIERSLVMKAQPEVIYPQINNLKNWGNWSPWHRMDSNMTIVYEGSPEGKGAKYTWQSEEVGDGTLEIVDTEPNSRIVTRMNFGPMGFSQGTYTLERVPEGTKVTWAMDSDGEGIDWKWAVPSKYLSLFMDRFVGPDFEKGLANLNTLTENSTIKSAEKPEYKIEPVNVKPQSVITLKTTCTAKEISAKLGEMYGKLMGYAGKSGLQPAGAPFAIYHYFSYDTVIMEAGIPVNKPGKNSGDIKAYEMKGGKTISTKHFGRYEDTEYAHEEIYKWAEANKKQITGAPWEVYVTDPGIEKDTAKWLTEIYYPVQ